MTAISIFDLDRTLTIRPTYSAFLLYANLRLAPWRLALLPVLVPYAAAYATKRIARRRMKERMHSVALGRKVPRHRIERIAENFAVHLVKTGIFPQVHELFAAERKAGRRIVLATAAPALYVEPLARHLDIDDVIATRNTWHEDHLLPDIPDDNCYAETKQQRIAAWLTGQGIDRADVHLKFYSDHASDLPTFEWVDEAIAVNPSSRLQAIAEVRDWPVLDWRKQKTA
ncbi:HAD-IB family hydrolase [Altericroceibacterium spongiae]|uniref:HAD-IB family hydrolase n=1 Tax=Altericroceibacterium spongiae TaxID=2320269 RepID=A0A420EM74_9SPHN|nr:HAD-IB family hydrolase [Altericroceibacterium spongiae]RKF21815.1 HAD-IB family hydrolase [Altericroceibacterium spongiae]